MSTCKTCESQETNYEGVGATYRRIISSTALQNQIVPQLKGVVGAHNSLPMMPAAFHGRAFGFDSIGSRPHSSSDNDWLYHPNSRSVQATGRQSSQWTSLPLLPPPPPPLDPVLCVDLPHRLNDMGPSVPFRISCHFWRVCRRVVTAGTDSRYSATWRGCAGR